MPRTATLALDSPPLASARMPGTARSTSVAQVWRNAWADLPSQAWVLMPASRSHFRTRSEMYPGVSARPVPERISTPDAAGASAR